LNIYVSLKIHKAENYGICNELRFLELFRGEDSDSRGRKSMPTLLHHFTIHGPNGTHLCLVTSVGGPSIKSLCSEGRKLPPHRAQNTARKLVEAVQYLHDLEICHGGESRFASRRSKN
jgi:serine/threonine protein kinase